MGARTAFSLLSCSLFFPARRTLSDTLGCRKESKANVSHCDCGEKKTEEIWCLAGSLGVVFEKYNSSTISQQQ